MMSESEARLGVTLRRLRETFDRSFERPQPPPAPSLEDLLSLRLGPHRFAIRLRELDGIERCPSIVPLPGGPARLLGLAGIRGQIVPAFSLPLVLGIGSVDPGGSWLALVGRDDPLALVFAELEGFPRVPAEAIHPRATTEERAHHAVEAVGPPVGPCPVLSAASIVAALRGGGATPGGPG